MGYAILPALIPDIEQVYDAYFAAFHGDKMGELMLQILFPGGVSPEFRKAHTAATLDWWHKSKVQYTFKAVDTDNGDIVGMGLGDVLLQGRTEEERKFQGVPWLEGEQKTRAEAVLKPLHDMREHLFAGARHAYCHVIAVHPRHQGLKIGALWCQWAMQLSNSLELPVYFESSPSTIGLYVKLGFERLEEKIVHSAELMGTEKDIEVPLMVYMPTAAKGMTFKEWRSLGYPAFGKTQAAKPVDESAVEKTSGNVNVEVAEIKV